MISWLPATRAEVFSVACRRECFRAEVRVRGCVDEIDGAGGVPVPGTVGATVAIRATVWP